jgi:hypothetical protein
MSDSNAVPTAARSETESADWRPFNVWAEHVRPAQESTENNVDTDLEAPRETWDPFSVWKRQVRGA